MKDGKPEWYYAQRLVCCHVGCGKWKAAGVHIFRDDGTSFDGEVINADDGVPFYDKCPKCGLTLSGELDPVFWLEENLGSLYIWDERPE